MNTTYRWVKASERLPKENALYFIRNMENGTKKIAQFHDGEFRRDFDPHTMDWEWLEEIEPPSIDTVDYEKETVALLCSEFDCHTDDLQLNLTLNPDKDRILKTMVKGCQIQAARQEALVKDLEWWKREESIKCELIIELRERLYKYENTKPVVSAEEMVSNWGVSDQNCFHDDRQIVQMMKEYANQFKGKPSIQQISDAWVSVQDRLPTADDLVNGAVWAWSMRTESAGKVNHMHITLGGAFSHWMPLPKKPTITNK